MQEGHGTAISHVHACGYFELYYCVGKLTFIVIATCRSIALHGTATHACMHGSNG